MMCHAMRERMLDADIDELEGRGTSLLAVHVRECATCAEIARGIVRDTQVLASVAARSSNGVVALVPRRGRGRSYLMIGGAAAIAAGVLFAVANRTDSPVLAPPALVAAAPEVAAAAGMQRLMVGRRFADAQPIVAVPLSPAVESSPTPPAQEPGTVRAEPSEGVRAAVMQTNNPLITVVVLYKPLPGIQK